MKNILITGGSGLIGKEISQKLSSIGYKIKHLTRKKTSNNNFSQYIWDIDKNFIDEQALKNVHIIIHLAGETIYKRWTKKQKKKILKSRIDGANLILNKLKEHKKFPELFICSSGISFYSNNIKKCFTEEDPPGKNFLSQVAQNCEKNAKNFINFGIRVVIIRHSIVLSKNSIFFKKMHQMIKYRMCSSIGNGQQIIAWIYIKDLCQLYINIIKNSNWNGVYNAVSPNQLTNKNFLKILSILLKKPLWPFRIPSLIIKIVYGEMSEIILKGKGSFSTKKIRNMGFLFKYSKIKKSLKEILNNK